MPGQNCNRRSIISPNSLLKKLVAAMNDVIPTRYPRIKCFERSSNLIEYLAGKGIMVVWDMKTMAEAVMLIQWATDKNITRIVHMIEVNNALENGKLRFVLTDDAKDTQEVLAGL